MLQYTREVWLARSPAGRVRADDLVVVAAALPPAERGEMIVRNRCFSVDPATRVRLGGSSGRVGDLRPIEVGQALDGMAVGEVVESRVDGFTPGDLVLHSLGWREHAVVVPDRASHRVRRLPADTTDLHAYLGLLSINGFAAYVGLFLVADLQPGETVWVSAAAGAVGSLAVQLATAHGAHVVASARGRDKVAYLRRDLGVDRAFDYREGDLAGHVHRAAPDGIHVYFDNVGGGHLEAALDSLRPGGRVALCGAVASYESPSQPPGPTNLFQAISKGLTLTGFLAVTYLDHFDEYQQRAREWEARGAIDYRVTVAQGLDAAPGALVDMLGGRTVGKTLVDLP